MGEGNDKQINLQSRDATNNCFRPDPPCTRLQGHRNHGNLQHALSPSHGKAIQSLLLLEIRQVDTWKIAEKDPQNLSSMEPPAFCSKFLQQELDVFQEGSPLLFQWNRVGIFLLCEVVLLKVEYQRTCLFGGCYIRLHGLSLYYRFPIY